MNKYIIILILLASCSKESVTPTQGKCRTDFIGTWNTQDSCTPVLDIVTHNESYIKINDDMVCVVGCNQFRVAYSSGTFVSGEFITDSTITVEFIEWGDTCRSTYLKN